MRRKNEPLGHRVEADLWCNGYLNRNGFDYDV